MSAIVWERPGLDAQKPDERAVPRRPKGRADARAAAKAVERISTTNQGRVLRFTPPPALKRAYCFFHATPGFARMAMPVQDLSVAPEAAALPNENLGLRRFVLLSGSLALGALAGAVSFQVLRKGGVTGLEGLTLALSVILMSWIGFGFMTAVAGFLLALREGSAVGDASGAAPTGRTAILMPVYNEDPGRVMSAIQAMGEDLDRVGAAERFDIFILSDTRDDAIATAEAAGFLKLRLRLGRRTKVYYRRRTENTDRKAGNIADWVGRFGGAYDYMLVLDADSLMSAETMTGLARAMDGEERLGLLQTSPSIINAETPFARLQQFACRLYGPIFARGQEWWSGAEGNYWGHNAIIRVRAFGESAGLPHLSGPKPFGGHILSHDFIEAALLRRRGWAVRTTTALDGSYEETPPTLLDMATRDRRWCQGNLQHIRVLGAAGLHWISRLHIARGVLSYLTPALWLMLLVCGVIVWPGQDLRGSARHDVVALFELSLALLLAPKLMGLVLALTRRRERAGFGGAARLMMGVLAETALWALAAPVLMVMQCVAVVEVLLGRDSGWAAQRREGSELSPKEAWRAHRGHVALGLLAALAALLTNRDVLMWTSPVFLGLALSSFLSLHTSRAPTVVGTKKRWMFQIPEEHNLPPVMQRAQDLRERHAGQADNRRQIEAMLRGAVPVYGPERIIPAFGGQAPRLGLAA